MKSLESLLGSPKDFPIEITLSSGDRHVLTHPDYLHRHPHAGDFVLYPDAGPYSVVINPAQVVSIRVLRADSAA